MRLIDADALIKDVKENSESYFADDFAEFWVNRQPTIQTEQRWIPVTEIPPRGRDLMLKIHDACNSFFYYHMGFHDGEKYFTYNFFWEKDKDLEIVGWQLCPWEEGEQE